MGDWLADYLDWKADHPELDVKQAETTVNDGMARLFVRLGPPTDRTTEQ